MTQRCLTESVWIVAVSLLLVPVRAHAQSAIAGTVKDASGAILPGVSVEASSDALIERTRAVTTDGAGQYKIVDLRPGVYVVTFSLTGFQTVKRENVDLPSRAGADHRGRRADAMMNWHHRRLVFNASVRLRCASMKSGLSFNAC
jgi:hypothetical protein